MQTKTHTTYIVAWCVKWFRVCVVGIKWAETSRFTSTEVITCKVTSSDPSFGSTHFHRNRLCWREKQTVGQPAGIFACKQAK